MILNGWKEIAEHLSRGVRTVQRWEELGLPVRRPNAHIRSAVIAVSEELDAWVKSCPQGKLPACPSREPKQGINPAELAIRIRVLQQSLAQLRSLRLEQRRLMQQALERRAFLHRRKVSDSGEDALSASGQTN